MEEYKLQVYENKVLRKIFIPERDDVSEQFRILHNKELHDLYRLPSIGRTVK
jgi:hypothetical protein